MSEAALNKDAEPCICCANGNDLSDGDECQCCGRVGNLPPGASGTGKPQPFKPSPEVAAAIKRYEAKLAALPAPQPDAGDEAVADDLVKRLRKKGERKEFSNGMEGDVSIRFIPDADCAEAAATIEGLRRELAKWIAEAEDRANSCSIIMLERDAALRGYENALRNVGSLSERYEAEEAKREAAESALGEARKVAVEVDRLSLVIESAVRNADTVNLAPVRDLIKATRSFLSSHPGEP